MTLQELRFIMALAQEKHFRKAAAACFVSQPTLSIAIRKIEQELGVALVERHKNAVRMTAIGKDIAERAKRILMEVAGIRQAAEADQNQLQGVFKLGAIFTVGPYLLPPLITALNKVAPNMPLEIQENYTARLREKLMSGELDAILISLPFSESGIITHTLYEEPFVVLMPADHPLASYQEIPEKALSAYTILLLGDGHCFRDQVISSCPRCFTAEKLTGINWRSVEGGSLETIRHMVASKMGLTILPVSAARVVSYDESILTTRPFKKSSPGRVVALAWRKSYTRIKAIAAVQTAATLMPALYLKK